MREDTRCWTVWDTDIGKYGAQITSYIIVKIKRHSVTGIRSLSIYLVLWSQAI